MRPHNQSKIDVADPVDDYVAAVTRWRTAPALLNVPIAMQRGSAPQIRNI